MPIHTLRRFGALALVLAVVSACGTSPRDRGASGAAIGAGAGAAGSALVGGSVLGGALVGGAAGAAAGLLTDSDQIDLGPVPRISR